MPQGLHRPARPDISPSSPGFRISLASGRLGDPTTRLLVGCSGGGVPSGARPCGRSDDGLRRTCGIRDGIQKFGFHIQQDLAGSAPTVPCAGVEHHDDDRDIQGRPLEVTDGRRARAGCRTYDMLGRVLVAWSADGRARTMLHAVDRLSIIPSDERGEGAGASGQPT